MKRSLVWLIPLAVLALCVSLRIAEPGALETIRLQVFDELQRTFRATWEDTAVRVVDIDEESLARIGQWPWPRTKVAALIARLTEAGAAAIAFDVVFAEPDRMSPAQIAPIWGNNPDLARLLGNLPDQDAALAATIARAPVVLGLFLGHAP